MQAGAAIAMTLAKKMHSIAPYCISVALVFVFGCEREGLPERQDKPSEAILALQELRSRTELSDDQIILAVERLAKTEQAWKSAIEAGLTTEEEIAEIYASMPETMLQLDRMESQMLGQDAMAAAVSLAALQQYHEGSIENALPALRNMISQYYRSIASDPSELEAGFMKKVEKLAERDAELAEMLEKQ